MGSTPDTTIPGQKVLAELITLGKVDAGLGMNSARRWEQSEDFANPQADDPATTLPAPLAVDFVATESVVDYIDDVPSGRIQVATLTATGGVGAAQISFGDQRCLSFARPGFVECDVLPTYAGAAPTADERWVFGLCTDHANAEDSLDATTINCWFRIEGNTSLLWETDDGTTNTDDQPTGETLAEGVWANLRIQWDAAGQVSFIYNGREVGRADMSAVANKDTSGLVQLISCYQRDASNEANSMVHDYMQWGNGRVSAGNLVQ